MDTGLGFRGFVLMAAWEWLAVKLQVYQLRSQQHYMQFIRLVTSTKDLYIGVSVETGGTCGLTRTFLAPSNDTRLRGLSMFYLTFDLLWRQQFHCCAASLIPWS